MHTALPRSMNLYVYIALNNRGVDIKVHYILQNIKRVSKLLVQYIYMRRAGRE